VFWNQPFLLYPNEYKFLYATIPDGAIVKVSAKADVDITLDIVKGSCTSIGEAYINGRVYKAVRGMEIEFSIILIGAEPWCNEWTFAIRNTDPIHAQEVYYFNVIVCY
jgi:hypothetical protein